MTEQLSRHTIVIAEAGVNHDGNLDCALRLVDVAADAGADMVKFQTFVADRLATAAAPKAAYQNSGDNTESHFDMLKRLELSMDAHRTLIDYCKTKGIGFLSTGFDVESVDELHALGQRLFKVPSGELTNLPYLRHVGGLAESLILSTGMATLEEIGAALAALEAAGTPRERVTVLHCNTAYPTPMLDVNLRAMAAIGEHFGVAVGYSDHTMGIEVAIAAVALGATVIEKHFTLDRNLPGPDHKASLEPHELAEMMRAIRNLEKALGDGIKRPTVSESVNLDVARKSIVAVREIRAGERFTSDNVAVKRPGSGLSPMLWDDVIGREAPRDFAPDEPIEL